MINKFFLIFFGALCLLGLLVIAYKQDNSEATFNKVIGSINRKLEKKYKLSTDGIGGSETEEGIRSIKVLFSRREGSISKKAGRKMIVDCTEIYLNEINTNEEIRKFLMNHPFTTDNVSIGIINYQVNGDNLFDPEISVFSSGRGKIYYKTIDPNNRYDYKSETNEPYLVALEIVKKENEFNSF